jgi:hypothetical protein
LRLLFRALHSCGSVRAGIHRLRDGSSCPAPPPPAVASDLVQNRPDGNAIDPCSGRRLASPLARVRPDFDEHGRGRVVGSCGITGDTQSESEDSWLEASDHGRTFCIAPALTPPEDFVGVVQTTSSCENN